MTDKTPANGAPPARRGGVAMRLFGLVRKEFLQVIRDPSSIAIAFIMPVTLLLLFGYGVSLDSEHVPVGVVIEDSSADAAQFAAGFLVAALLDQAPGELETSAREVRVGLERLTLVLLGPADVASHEPRGLERHGAGQRQARRVIRRELEGDADLPVDGREEKGGAGLAPGRRPSAEVGRVPEVSLGVPRRQLRRQPRDVSAPLIACQLLLRRARPEIGPGEMYPGQKAQGLDGALASDRAFEKRSGSIDPLEVLMVALEQCQSLGDGTRGRLRDCRDCGDDQKRQDDGSKAATHAPDPSPHYS